MPVLLVYVLIEGCMANRSMLLYHFYAGICLYTQVPRYNSRSIGMYDRMYVWHTLIISITIITLRMFECYLLRLLLGLAEHPNSSHVSTKKRDEDTKGNSRSMQGPIYSHVVLVIK